MKRQVHKRYLTKERGVRLIDSTMRPTTKLDVADRSHQDRSDERGHRPDKGTDRTRILGAALAAGASTAVLPLVSIVVTAFDCARFVPATLRSVHAQRYARFECIIVEDASTDDTLAVIERLLEELADPRFVLVRHDQNRGQLAAQITGFQHTHGDFVVFLDADDLLFEDALEAQVSAHIATPSIVPMICFDSLIINEHDTVLAGHTRDAPLLHYSWFQPNIQRFSLAVLGERADALHIPAASGNMLTGVRWYWSTQSFMMFRRDALELILPERTELFRACADFYLVRMLHALNGTLMVRRQIGAYRIHGRNQYAARMLVSSDQHNADHRRFKWQESQLATLASEVVAERFERFAAAYGESRMARCLMSLPSASRPALLPLLQRRLSAQHAAAAIGFAAVGRAGAHILRFARNVGHYPRATV